MLIAQELLQLLFLTLSSCVPRYGEIDTVRLRSVAVKPDSKKPRRAAIIAGEVLEGHSAHAYVVFKDTASVEAALAHNMQLVTRPSQEPVWTCCL